MKSYQWFIFILHKTITFNLKLKDIVNFLDGYSIFYLHER